MKIYGDALSTEFKTYVKEPGCLYGSNDVLKGEKKNVYIIGTALFDPRSNTSSEYEPKLYLHIPTNLWSTFTGKLREYLSPWFWEVAYLDREDGKAPQRILINAAPREDLSDRLKSLLGKSLFITKLIKEDLYNQSIGYDFLRIKGTGEPRVIKIQSATGYGGIYTADSLCHFYYAEGLFSSIGYFFLKTFSPSWKEVALQVDGLTQKILIKKDDEALIAKAGLIKS